MLLILSYFATYIADDNANTISNVENKLANHII